MSNPGYHAALKVLRAHNLNGTSALERLALDLDSKVRQAVAQDLRRYFRATEHDDLMWVAERVAATPKEDPNAAR